MTIELPSWVAKVPNWTWMVVAGVFAGMAIAHVADVMFGGLKKWFFGETAIQTHFSPKGGCTEAVVAELDLCRKEIWVQAYSFTSKPIAEALFRARDRGVAVCILLDKSNEAETHTELPDLIAHGMDIRIDPCHAIAHNKVMVLDSRTVITGSFNFTFQAEHENAENLMILRNHRELAQNYRANFEHHREHCVAPGTAKVTQIPERTHRKAA